MQVSYFGYLKSLTERSFCLQTLHSPVPRNAPTDQCKVDIVPCLIPRCQTLRDQHFPAHPRWSFPWKANSQSCIIPAPFVARCVTHPSLIRRCQQGSHPVFNRMGAKRQYNRSSCFHGPLLIFPCALPDQIHSPFAENASGFFVTGIMIFFNEYLVFFPVANFLIRSLYRGRIRWSSHASNYFTFNKLKHFVHLSKVGNNYVSAGFYQPRPLSFH
jgi:hypothetical protein